MVPSHRRQWVRCSEVLAVIGSEDDYGVFQSGSIFGGGAIGSAAEATGVTICRAAGANARGVAELTLASMLALVRSVPFSDAALKADGWERRKGIELEGRTLGLVGCGKIGNREGTFPRQISRCSDARRVVGKEVEDLRRLRQQFPGLSHK